jgi:hypothetical protein
LASCDAKRTISTGRKLTAGTSWSEEREMKEKERDRKTSQRLKNAHTAVEVGNWE